MPRSFVSITTTGPARQATRRLLEGGPKHDFHREGEFFIHKWQQDPSEFVCASVEIGGGISEGLVACSRQHKTAKSSCVLEVM